MLSFLNILSCIFKYLEYGKVRIVEFQAKVYNHRNTFTSMDNAVCRQALTIQTSQTSLTSLILQTTQTFRHFAMSMKSKDLFVLKNPKWNVLRKMPWIYYDWWLGLLVLFRPGTSIKCFGSKHFFWLDDWMEKSRMSGLLRHNTHNVLL